MKRLSIYLIFMFLVGLFVSCKEKYDFRQHPAYVPTSQSDSLTLGFTGTKKIIIDTRSYDVYTIYQSVMENGCEKLIGFNESTYCIDIFSINNDTNVVHISLNTEGPDGIPEIDDFFYHNRDTIFFLSISMNTIYLGNHSGKVLDKYTFRDMELPDGFKRYTCYAVPELHNRLYYTPKTACLHFYAYRWIDFAEDWRDYPNFVAYSINNREFVSLYGCSPPVYRFRNNYGWYNDPSFLVVDTLSYVSFPITPEVYCYDNRTGDLLAVYDGGGRSWNNSKVKPFRTEIIELQEENNFMIETPAFIKLAYDPGTRLFYRFLKHKRKLRDSDGLLNHRWTGPWSILMFDNGFNLVGEREIPPNTVFNLFSFPANNGLLIKSLAVDSVEEFDTHNVLFEFKPIRNEKENGN